MKQDYKSLSLFKTDNPANQQAIPSPGGGVFVGPGGLAPPFAPGGPQDPYPASAGMPPPSFKSQELGPQSFSSQPNPLMSDQGSVGATPYPAFPSPSFPSPSFPTQQKGVTSMPQAGFLARIIPMAGGDAGQLPAPMPPGIGMPTFPGQLPGTSPGNPSIPPGGVVTPPIVPPDMGGGPTMGKPRGIKTLPMPKNHKPPEGPPKPPGQWVTLDAGRGQPPAYGFIESEDPGTDSGLEPTPKKGGASTLPSRPSGEKGHYVPVQIPYVHPVLAEIEEDVEPTWCWVPDIGSDYGVKEPEAEPKK